MPRQATKASGNVYFEARMRAAKCNDKLITRVGAADFLPGVTEDSLKKYELDITKPPNVVVALMAEAYIEPQLRLWYCVHECPLGVYCREIPIMPPERALIRLQNTAYQLTPIIQRLAKIMEDGKISEAEQQQIPDIVDCLLEVRRRADESLTVLERAVRIGTFT